MLDCQRNYFDIEGYALCWGMHGRVFSREVLTVYVAVFSGVCCCRSKVGRSRMVKDHRTAVTSVCYYIKALSVFSALRHFTQPTNGRRVWVVFFSQWKLCRYLG